MNPMYYRYLTTSEVNELCGTDLAVADDADLGEDEIGFFVWDERFHRPVVVIEVDSSATGAYIIQVARTNGTGPRPGASGPLSEYRTEIDSVLEVNAVVRECAEEFTPEE